MLVEEVRAKLPIKTIPNIIGDTTYKAINELRDALYTDAAAINTMHRGGGGWQHRADNRHIRLCETVHYGAHKTDKAGCIFTAWGR